MWSQTPMEPPAAPHVSEHHQPGEDEVGAHAVYVLNHPCDWLSNGVQSLCWLWQAQAGTQPLMMMMVLAVCSRACSCQWEVVSSERSLLRSLIELIPSAGVSITREWMSSDWHLPPNFRLGHFDGQEQEDKPQMAAEMALPVWYSKLGERQTLRWGIDFSMEKRSCRLKL